MTLIELGKKLEEMYLNAQKGDKVTSIHLFGIKYNDTIKSNNYSVKEIIIHSKLPLTYQTELSKGMKLSNFVTIKNSYLIS